MDNYPPGVTGNEPQITGEWPCSSCSGYKGDVQECDWCNGTGIEPEDIPYCRNCDKTDNEVDVFFINPVTDQYACNFCLDESSYNILDNNWEER